MLAPSKTCCALSHTTVVCRLALPQLPTKSKGAGVKFNQQQSLGTINPLAPKGSELAPSRDGRMCSPQPSPRQLWPSCARRKPS